jgi:hypothetical protein
MPRLLTDEASNKRREVRHLGQEVARLALSGPDEWGGVLRRLRPTDIQTTTLYTKPTQSDLDKVIDELDKNDGNSRVAPTGFETFAVAIGPARAGQKRPRLREAAQCHAQRQTRTGILLWVRVSLPKTRAETPLCP